MKTYDLAIRTMNAVFDEMDKDFTIWEYRNEIKELLRCAKFVSHINSHFQEEHPDWDVKCKICGKTMNELVEVYNG